MTRKEMIEDVMKQLENIERRYYNAFEGNIFEIAIYLYNRYGEIPIELENEDKLKKLSSIINKQFTLINESINEQCENLIDEDNYEEGFYDEIYLDKESR